MYLDHSPPQRTAWFIWSLGALFYLMGFFHRVAPAVMTEELMREFNINATALGNLSAFYFYSYVAMQIPTGILADTWGPRRLLTIGSLSAGIGTLLFALAPQIIWANLGRLVIGGSVAVAFVGLLKVANNWFPPRHYAMVSGVALFFGIIGAVFAGTPLRLLMHHYS
jgi:MFS family permease